MLIYGINCGIPDKPNKIYGESLTKKQQKFSKATIPEDFYEIEFDADGMPIYSPEQVSFIKEQWDRCEHGFWFMNNGEATYITGLHYYYLNFWTLESGVTPEYRDADRKYFIFYQECKNNPDILGIIRVKKRREGATSQASCALTKYASTVENARCGIISKTGTDASDLFINMIVYGFRGLPIFFQPRTDGAEDPKKKLTFVKPSKKTTTRSSFYNKREGLNSFIEWRNTALNSFDSGRWSELLIDEASKYEMSIIAYWDIVKKTLTEGANKVGFAQMVSTVNPPNSGGQLFKDLWDSSNQFKYGTRTASRLVRYFCPADEGLAGFIDEYGMSQKEEARAYILEERGKSKSEQDIRDYPLNESEAFKFDETGCYFNLSNIEAQEQRLKENQPPLRRGRLYIDGEGKVQFSDDKAGYWLVYKMPKISNSITIRNNAMYPNLSDLGMGVDPYRNSQTVGQGSMGSAWIGEKYDAKDPENSCMPIAWFYGRPKLKKLFWKEMLMGSIFWGVPATIEADAGDDFYDYFKSENEFGYNCLPMLGKRPDAAIDPVKKGKINWKQRGVVSGDPYVLGKQLEYGIAYIEHHSHKIMYPQLLADLKSYKHEDREDYDISVSFLIMLLTLMGQTRATAQAKKINPIIETFSIDSFQFR